MLVKDWMSTKVITVSPEDNLLDVKNVMTLHGIRRIPVLKAGAIVGIISDRDLRDFTPSHCTGLDVMELQNKLYRMRVEDVMTTYPLVVTSTTTVEEAARLMYKRKIGGLPVIDGGKLVGIITESDVFRMVGASKAAETTTETAATAE
jgi:acetoin utilization protein AcuB